MEERGEVIAGQDVAGGMPAAEYPAARGAAQRRRVGGHLQPGSLAQAEHGNVVFLQELAEPLVACLPQRAVVLAGVMRVDLEGDQSKGRQ